MGKYCANCGNELNEGARFCGGCGAVISQEPKPVQQPIEAAQTFNAHTVQKKRGTRALSIALAVVLIAQTTAVALYGWPGFAVGGGFGMGETFTLKPDRASVETNDGVMLDMGEYPLDSEAKCEIKRVNAPRLEGVEIQAYDFSVDTEEELISVMELTIPYDKKALGDLKPEGNVGAAYYNEESGEWEPVSFDINDNGTVTIYTEHLSTYGCFVIENEKTRDACAAYAIPSRAISHASEGNVDANAIITSAVNNGGNPTMDAVEAGLSILDIALAIGAAGVDTISYGLNSVSGVMGNVEGNNLFNSLSEKLGHLGMAVSIAQIANGMCNVYYGNTDAIFPCYRDSLKGSMAYIGGQLGNKLFSLAFLGVVVVDYSINKFGETAKTGREDIYRKAYSLYYEEKENQRSAKEWANVFLAARQTAKSTDRYYLRIEGLVKRYTDQFWKDELAVSYYQSQAQKAGFTGGGGLNEAMKEEISKEHADKLFRGVLQDAFKLIAERDARIAEKNLFKELNEIREKLNKVCTLEIYDESVSNEKKKSDMAGAGVFVSLPDDITDAEKWSTVLNDKGEGRIQFTLLAYLMAGLPDELRLYEKGTPQNEEPDATFSFLMKDYTQRLNVGAEALSLDQIVGKYDVTVSFEGDEEKGFFEFDKSGESLIAIDSRGNSMEMSYAPDTGTAVSVREFGDEDDVVTLTTTFVFRLENGVVKMSGEGFQTDGKRSNSAYYQAVKTD